MKTRLLALCAAGVCLVMVSVPALAHHGAAAFDKSKQVSLKGTVTEFRFINPHVLITWTVKAADGTVQKWDGEMTSPNRLARDGWSRHTLKPGDQIKITGYASKNGAKTLWIRKVARADGQPLITGLGN